MDSIDSEQGKLVHQYKKVQNLLKRLITTVFPTKTIKYLVDYALVQSEDRSSEYIEYVLYHYTYLNNVSALRQKYADLYGSDKSHEFALKVFTYLAEDAKQFYDTMHYVEMPNIEVKDEYIPSKVLDIPQKSSKNRRRKIKRLQQTEDELFEEMAKYNIERAKKFTDIWNSLEVVATTLNIKNTAFPTIIKNYLFQMSSTHMHKSWTDKKRDIFARGVFAYVAIYSDMSKAEEVKPGTINTLIYSYLAEFYNTFDDENVYPALDDDDMPFTKVEIMVTLHVSIHPDYYVITLPKYALLSSGFLQMAMLMDLIIIMNDEDGKNDIHICLKCENEDCPTYKRRDTCEFTNVCEKRGICNRCTTDLSYPNNLCLLCDVLDVEVTPDRLIVPTPLIGIILELGPEKAKKELNY